uniref:Uncharacterized protein n=1 Tax=Lotus japonicus TaxID=34305 RepID=I3SU04_LOTJA|nr:unknown [Lotus japonicus]
MFCFLTARLLLTHKLNQTHQLTRLIENRETLTPKSIECPSLSLESIHHIHGSNSLPPSMLSVGNSITNHILKKDLENTTSLLIDQATDTLHATPASQTPNRWLRDSLDVVAEDLTVPFGSSLAQSFTSFSTPRHGEP